MHNIYDKMFKKILTLSGKSVIHFINGLFGTNYPTDSKIDYNWTEFENDKLKKTLADTILTVNGEVSYHIEAQMTKDKSIIFRMFEYGYGHAEHMRVPSDDSTELNFPEPKIIYLYAEGKIPKEYCLKLNFGTQGSFFYRVPTLRLQGISIEELNQKKLIILIPFFLLKLRKSIRKKRTEENIAELKRLFRDDIIGSIDTNFKVGNITQEDVLQLKNLTQKLFEYLYSHYEEIEEVDIMDESLVLDVDIYLKQRAEDKKRIAVLEKENQRIAVLEKEIQQYQKQLEEFKRRGYSL